MNFGTDNFSEVRIKVRYLFFKEVSVIDSTALKDVILYPLIMPLLTCFYRLSILLKWQNVFLMAFSFMLFSHITLIAFSYSQ